MCWIRIVLNIPYSFFAAWHRFLNSEIDNRNMNARVFTPNNHYLSHLALLIRQMGPLRAYSCRSMERTIKLFTNLIKSTSHTGVNASNILRRQSNQNKMAVRQLLEVQFPSRPAQVGDYETSPSGLQVWKPSRSVSLLGDGDEDICFGTTRSRLIAGLKSYYTRLSGERVISLEMADIELFGRAWRDSFVYSSTMNRRIKNLQTRADNVVLFEVMTRVRDR